MQSFTKKRLIQYHEDQPNPTPQRSKRFVHSRDFAIIVKRRKDSDIEETPMTEIAVDSSANDAPVTDEHGNKGQKTKTILITVGVLILVAGVGLLGLVYRIGEVDTHSVTVVLSEDRMGQEVLAKFRYTSWRESSGSIRPFVHGPKSFEDCKILRYRRGSRPNGFFRYTHYQAEYRMPDGSQVIGPAFGPLPYTAPNLFVLGPLIIGGVIILVVGIALRVDKLTELEKC